MSDVTVRLHAIAHARTGDKGNRLNCAVIAYAEAAYPILEAQVTEARIAALFAHRRPARIARFLLPQLWAINLVIDEVLEGGVNGSLGLDGHGKTLSFLVLTLPVTVPAAILAATQAAIGAQRITV
jgi:hypothetical protein